MNETNVLSFYLKTDILLLTFYINKTNFVFLFQFHHQDVNKELNQLVLLFVRA